MLSGDSLSTLLFAIATGHVDRAKNVIYMTDELDETERKRLREVVEENGLPGAQLARNLGDAFRELGADKAYSNECYRLAFYASADSADLTENPLFAYFAAHRTGRLLDKWVHYFPIYDRYLASYRGRSTRMLEIGVFRGGSLDMWRRYLGPYTTLIGIDIDETALLLADPGSTVLIGDQADTEFLRTVVEQHGPFDIIIDDGGHTMEQQIASIEALFPSLNDGGVYLVEDCHTSYWDDFGGGLRREGTFIEWVKDRVDDLHSYHYDRPTDRLWTDHVDGIHCYDSVIVLEKKRRFAPFSEQVGDSSFVYNQRPISLVVGEMLATRDAAIAQHSTAEEQTRLADERLSATRGESAKTAKELEVTRNDLLESWEQLSSMRRTFSWRVTAPLRALRRRMRRP